MKNLKFVFVVCCLVFVLFLIDAAQNKASFTKERNLDQWSEKFMSDNSEAELKENLRQNLTNSTKSDTKICTILSSHQDVTITEPAAAVSKVLIQVWAMHMEKKDSTANLPCSDFCVSF